MGKISISTIVEIDPREGHWAGYVPALGSTVYAESQVAARNEAYRALPVLIDSLGGNTESVENFLNRHNVHYKVEREYSTIKQTVSTEVIQAEVLIAG